PRAGRVPRLGARGAGSEPGPRGRAGCRCRRGRLPAARTGGRGGPQGRHRGGRPAPPRGLRRGDGTAARTVRLAGVADPSRRGGDRRRGREPHYGIAGVIQLKTETEVAKMRAAGLVVAETLAAVRAEVAPGVTPRDLDARAAAEIRARGAVPSFLGYHGFPATLCVSVNDEIVHGIPGDRPFRNGDTVSI